MTRTRLGWEISSGIDEDTKPHFLPPLKGLDDIAKLVEPADTVISATRLRHGDQASVVRAAGAGLDMVTEEGIKKARERVREIDNDLAEGRHPHRSQELEREKQDIETHILSSTRPSRNNPKRYIVKKAAAAAERDANAVRERIKKAENDIKAAGLPRMAEHLHEQIRRGVQLKYRTQPGIRWLITSQV